MTTSLSDNPAPTTNTEWPAITQRVVLASVVVSSIPLLYFFRKFMRLFWFSDEIALLHEWSQIGFSQWMMASFGENVSPVYKIIWGGAVIESGGDYDCMVLVLWITHLLLVAVFASLLKQHSFNNFSVFFAASIFGVAWSSHYLLTMSYHLNAGLCLLFALLALWVVTDPKRRNPSLIGKTLYLLFLTCSVLSFSRGMILAAAFCLYWLLRLQRSKEKSHIVLAALSLIPVGITLFLLFSNADTTNKLGANFTDNLEEKFQYAITFLALNPLYRLLNLPNPTTSFSLSTVCLAGFLGAKLFVYAYGLIVSKKSNHSLFCLCVTLVTVDLLHSALLGYGRAGEGLETALVSRYQRASLFSFTPLFAITFYALTEWIVKNFNMRVMVRSVATTLFLYSIFLPWEPRLKHQVRWQGNMGREALLKDEESHREKWHGIPPHITVTQARETAKHFQFQP